MRRITKAALGGIAGGALILAGTQAAGGALTGIYKYTRDSLTDLTTSAAGPFDSAKAAITVDVGTDSTTFTIRLTGIGTGTYTSATGDTYSVVGTTLGSHLHTGPCIEGTGGSAGPHYNHDVVVGGKEFPVPGERIHPQRTAEVSPDTEVWFDLVPNEAGEAYDETTVPFVPVDPDGVMSVVVHVAATNPETGAAGARQACFPLSVPQFVPEPA
jgi:Cu/Zn superoxide dismutase